MEDVRYRKHPRVYHKKPSDEKEKSLNLSGAAAIGIIALAFFKGMFWGYMIKRRLG